MVVFQVSEGKLHAIHVEGAEFEMSRQPVQNN